MHTKDGVLYGADGKIVSGIDFDLDKVLSEVVAKETAINAVNANIFAWEIIEVESQLKSDLKDPNATNYPTGKLVITQVEPDKWTNENYRLAYKFDIICIEPDQHIIVYVDAISGIVIKTLMLVIMIVVFRVLLQQNMKDQAMHFIQCIVDSPTMIIFSKPNALVMEPPKQVDIL